jgi:hypothetical protein
MGTDKEQHQMDPSTGEKVDVDVTSPQPVMEPAPMAPAPATSDPFASPYTDDDALKPDRQTLTPMGISINVGGGLAGFTAENVRDSTEVGGGWAADVVIGTRSPLAFEAGYTGTANAIDALGLDGDAVLLGSGVQGLARLNFTIDQPAQPYIIAGAGWKHYDLTREDFNTSSVREDDDVLEVPVGAGIAYHINQFVVDLRGVFRPAFDSDLLAGGQDDAPLHNWQGRLNLGWEF